MVKAKNILLVRTDRIGELLLTTPAFQAIRKAFPEAKIAIVVNPFSAEVVEGSPYVDTIIKFEEKAVKGSFIKKLKFFREIKRLKFDLAVIFNPSKFFNVLTFLAGIPMRVGYDRKLGFLLSHRMKDRKYLCEKHEVEYNLDLIRATGIEANDKSPYFPLDEKAERVVKDILRDNAIKTGDLLVAVHPATSNPDKMWPPENVAQLSDRLINEFGAKVVLVGGEEEKRVYDEVKMNMKNSVIDLTGSLSIKELGSFLKRCKFLISNDSGPVHIAQAVGTPTIVFFGEKRPGGSSKRWGPYGDGHLVISKPKVADITVEEAYKLIGEKILQICQIN